MLDRAAAEELEVVDDDQAEVRLARLQPAGLRADLEHRRHARVVDVDRRLRQRVARLDEPRPVLLRELAGAEALQLDVRLGAHEPLHDLDLRHLEREDRRPGSSRRMPRFDATPSANADLPMLGRPATTTRLPGCRPGRHLVDAAEAGRRAGHLAARLVHLRDLLEGLADDHLDVVEACRGCGAGRGRRRAARPGRRARSSRPGGPSRAAGSARRRVVSPRSVAISRTIARVVARVRGRRDERRELVDALLAADLVELAALVELVGDRDRVDRLAVLVEVERREVDLRVRLRDRSRRRRRCSLTASIAAAESIIAPRTDSSASRFCGGIGAVARAWAGWAITR